MHGRGRRMVDGWGRRKTETDTVGEVLREVASWVRTLGGRCGGGEAGKKVEADIVR